MKQQTLPRGLYISLLVTLILAVALTACNDNGDNDAPSLQQPSDVGATLADKFLVLLADKDTDGLRSFLHESFMIQRADGSSATKADYLTRLPEIGTYTISDVAARQAGSTLVVRWTVAVNQVIDGRPYATAPAPRLSTFVWADGDWRLIAHANFNAPSAGNAQLP